MKTALFVDFDNVYSGLRRLSALGAERFARQPSGWLSWLTSEFSSNAAGQGPSEARRVLVRRCYLNPVMFHSFRRPFLEAGFEIVDCPPMTAAGKTTTDIHLVLDALDALADDTYFDEFIVFSADADFSPVLRRLRRQDRRTVVFAAGAMSEAYKASADRVIAIPEFLHDALELDSEDEEEFRGAQGRGPMAPTAMATASARQLIADRVTQIVREAPAPVALPRIAELLRREFPAVRDGQWAGAGTFGALMQQLPMPDVRIDFAADVAMDVRRMEPPVARPASDMPTQSVSAPPTRPGRDVAPAGGEMTAADLDRAVADTVRRIVSGSDRPVLLSLLGQQLRRELPALTSSWNGAVTLAGLLKRLDLAPIQREVLEDGSTAVLFDPTRHANPAGVVGDQLVASMLRAAEIPPIRVHELRRVLHHARQHMGTAEPFEISAVSMRVHDALMAEGVSMSARRVGEVLQGLIFGGLETSTAFSDDEELLFTAIGVVLAAWTRETQTPVDDEARNRLLAWMRTKA